MVSGTQVIPNEQFRLLNITPSAQTALIAGSRNDEPVRGLTHGFYKYPARFSPAFVRAAIQTFTQCGDLVLDNHVGGGTTLVEAIALGRHAFGVDISKLAEFVSTVKTTVLDDKELGRLVKFARHVADAVHMHRPANRFGDYADLGYYKHLDHHSRWRLRKAIEQALGSAVLLKSERLISFARYVVLRTAQWALDGRKRLPSVSEFRQMLTWNATEMIEGARQLTTAVKRYSNRPKVRVINRSAAGLENDHLLTQWPKPKLVLTSPPYPGIHVLYHRWQVDGRKEAPLPFMIADRLDGAGSSYYTMGDRKLPALRTYFETIRATMSSVAALTDDATTIVHVVAFADPTWQLPRYLDAMEEAGLSEVFLPILQGIGDGRLWRNVPGRKWYSDQRGETPGSSEVVLIHKKRTVLPSHLKRSISLQRPLV